MHPSVCGHVFSQVCTVVIGYLLAVCFKWSPQTEHYLRALALPVWAALLFYIGECEWMCLWTRGRRR